MEKKIIELINAGDFGSLFELIAREGWQIEKETLRKLAQELCYAIHEIRDTKEKQNAIENLQDNLPEYWNE